MVSARDVEVPADGVAMKCVKDDISEFGWHKLQFGIAFGSGDRLAVNKYAVFQPDLQLTQRLAIIGVNLSFVQVSLGNGTWVRHKTHDGR